VIVAIIASGPSLHADDVALIQQSGIYTLAVNSAWKHARFCNGIFAGDGSWWEAYAKEIDIPAERWCCRDQGQLFGTSHYKGASGWNSGANAIRLVIEELGAKRIILTGFDCSLVNGVHVHGPHEKTRNPQADDVARWHDHFSKVAGIAKQKGVKVINASRYSEITVFPKVPMNRALMEI